MLAYSFFCSQSKSYHLSYFFPIVIIHDSLHFHKKMGYIQVARMMTIGKKYDRWYDLLWLQKKL